MDSETINTRDWTIPLQNNAPIHRQAFDLLKSGIALQDPLSFGEAVTLSAKAHQKILSNPWLEQVLVLARQTGAIGVCRAHSGTILGLLYSKATCDEKILDPYLNNIFRPDFACEWQNSMEEALWHVILQHQTR